MSLDALLRERSVSRAARRLGLSQPALSAALRRLRRHFGDELLVRVGNSYRLTPLAVSLQARVSLVLEGVQHVFEARSDFDPALCTREFSVFTSDYALAVVGPPLMAALGARAPRARLRFLQPALARLGDTVGDLRAADALISPHGYPANVPHVDLFRDRWVCIVSLDNTTIGDSITLEELARSPWVDALDGRTAYTPAYKQLRLQLHGASPNIEVVTDSFVAVPRMVAGTGRVALIQERLVSGSPHDLGVRVLECPFAALPLIEALWWHPLSDDDPEHRLLRSLFLEVATTLGEEPCPAAG